MNYFCLPVNPFSFSDAEIKTNAPVIIEIKTVGSSIFLVSISKDILYRRHSSISVTDDLFHRKSYKGGSPYINGDYLYSHPKEKADVFAQRKKRAYFYNYCRPVVDSYLYFLFKANPVRTGDEASEPDVIAFIADPSLSTEDLNDFMKAHAFTHILLGRAWIRMDTPANAPETLREELVRQNLPYIYHIPAEDVLDWQEESEGRFSWVKFISRRDEKSTFDYESSSQENVVIMTKDAIATYDCEGVLITAVPNLLGQVTFIRTSLNEELQSFIADISIVNRSLFNWCSLLDEILYKQTFSQLVVPGDKNQRLSEKLVGTAEAFTFDPKSTHAPHYIFPDPEQGKLVQSQISTAIQEIYRAANLEWVDSAKATNKSGEAKSFDFQNTNKVLGGIAGKLEQTESRIFELFNLIRGKDSKKHALAQYPRDFSVAALESELTNIFFALTRNISRTFNIQLKKRAVDLISPRMEEKLRGEIGKEIEDTEAQNSVDAELQTDAAQQRVERMLAGAQISNVKGQPGRAVNQAISK